MAFDIKKLRFPKYIGLESQYEHNIYNYLDETLGKLGYLIKIKKTEYENVDNCLVSGGMLKCDAYIFNNKNPRHPDRNLIALFELESNKPKSNLKEGIKQIKGYCTKLHSGYIKKIYDTENTIIKAIVYDGQVICIWDYDIEKDLITQIVGNPDENVGETMSDTIKERFLSLFPQQTKIEDEDTESKLIKSIKEDLRTNQLLQSNKSFLMTILASIYGKTKKDTLEEGLDSLKRITDSEAQGILKKWNQFSSKIDYYKNKDTIDNKLYSKAKKLWVLSQNKKMDLYGFIYEELVEENNKKNDGEFYTSRHLIKPIIYSVFKKYLQPYWKINSENILESISKRKIHDPFCGSGGFLYEILRLLKQDFQLKDQELNKIAKSSLFGFDKNDTMSAFLNLYLIGDGESNLIQVSSSINWQNIWRYEVKSDNKPVLIKEKNKLKNNIDASTETFMGFLNMLIDWEQVKEDFKLNLRGVCSINDFYVYHENEEKAKLSIEEDFKFFYNLIYVTDKENCVLNYIYGLLKNYSSNPDNIPSFKDFCEKLGAVDFLPTNVPYGPVNDARFSTDNKGTLESLALKECIDLLRPSTYRNASYNESLNRYEDDQNGEPKSNDDGGIATIILPNRIFEGGNEKELRNYLFERCNVLSVIKLPLHSFCPYATIQTFILTIRKKAPFEFGNTKQINSCFFYIVDNDGKANSKNRYPTGLINDDTTNILDKDNNLISNVHEYLHDDFKTGIEMYPEGYLSKIERAWIYGKDPNVSKMWNQNRYTEKWNGENWEKINTTALKWTYSNLKIKQYEKRIEKKNKKVSDLFADCMLNSQDFIGKDFDEQKTIVINKAKQNLVKPIEKINVSINIKGKVTVSILPSNGIIGIKTIKNFILENYKSIEYLEEKQKSFQKLTLDIISFKNYVENYLDYSVFGSDISNIVEFMNDIEEVVIDEETVKFYTTESYEQYNLVPEYYLGKNEDIMSSEEILENVKRLRRILKED